MTANDTDTFGSVIRKLEKLNPLDAADCDAIRSLPYRIRPAAANSWLVREGETVTECCLLLRGFACRHKATSSGGRQIVSFHLPGDILDIQHLLLSRADHNVQTITDALVAVIPIRDLKHVARERPAVGDALWRDSLIDASIFREWVLNVGRRDARERVAHLLCEFAARRDAAGLGSPERFELPMSQEQIADATGLTPIHVNRMLRVLAEEGVLARDRRHIEITDWPRMKRVADFHPGYLHAAA